MAYWFVWGSSECRDEKRTESVLNSWVWLMLLLVATIAPMKRGLKGTVASHHGVLRAVATIAPMKRGLKVLVVASIGVA